MYTVVAPVVLALTLAAPSGAQRAGLTGALVAAGYWPAPQSAKKPKKAKAHSDDGGGKATDKLEDEVFDEGGAKSEPKPKPEPRAKAKPKPKSDEDEEAESDESEDEEETPR